MLRQTTVGMLPGSIFTALAFDSRSQLLYYADDGLNMTGIIAVKGGHHKILASYTNTFSPQGLALDVSNKYACTCMMI